MEFEPTEFVRKSFAVKAMIVTFKNVEKIAEWCDGKVDTETTHILGGATTELPVVKFAGKGEDKGKTLVARLGNLVVLFPKSRFRVYKEQQFYVAFEQKVVLQEKKGADIKTFIVDEIADGKIDWCLEHNRALAECDEMFEDATQ